MLHAVAYKTMHQFHTHMSFKLKTSFLYSGLIATPFFILEEIPSVYVLDWCVVCTGLVCCMYWTDVLYVLDWCVVCTGLVCCMYWTGVLYALDWCVVCTGLAIPVQNTSPVHKPVQFNTPVQYIIHCMFHVVCTRLVCCMREEERGWSSAPVPLLKREGGGEKY